MFKIVPPPDWNYPCQITMDNPKRFPTKLQKVHTLQQGLGFEDGATYNIREYKAMADRFFEHWKDTHHGGQVPTVDMLAKDYWDMVETGMQSAAVEYGNDVDSLYFGSGFPKQTDPDTNMYSRWNMNRLPVDASSLLKFLKAPISGINVPWIYIGMLFATFCWHYEDNNLYSINYSHFGSTKQWYGVPGHQAELFEKVICPCVVCQVSFHSCWLWPCRLPKTTSWDYSGRCRTSFITLQLKFLHLCSCVSPPIVQLTVLNIFPPLCGQYSEWH